VGLVELDQLEVQVVQELLVLQAQQVLLGSQEAPEAQVVPEVLEDWVGKVRQVLLALPVQLVLPGVLVELDRREERAELVAQEGLELTE
jgi:hypothetical protein